MHPMACCRPSKQQQRERWNKERASARRRRSFQKQQEEEAEALVGRRERRKPVPVLGSPDDAGEAITLPFSNARGRRASVSLEVDTCTAHHLRGHWWPCPALPLPMPESPNAEEEDVNSIPVDPIAKSNASLARPHRVTVSRLSGRRLSVPTVSSPPPVAISQLGGRRLSVPTIPSPPPVTRTSLSKVTNSQSTGRRLSVPEVPASPQFKPDNGSRLYHRRSSAPALSHDDDDVDYHDAVIGIPFTKRHNR